jgi:hypothetical protein
VAPTSAANICSAAPGDAAPAAASPSLGVDGAAPIGSDGGDPRV